MTASLPSSALFVVSCGRRWSAPVAAVSVHFDVSSETDVPSFKENLIILCM